MNKIIKSKLKELTQLCKDYQVRTLHIFGSVTTDEFSSSSDIDLLIKFENINVEQYTNNYFELHYRLQALFGREIDLLTENSLSNPYFIEKIEQTKKLIYAA